MSRQLALDPGRRVYTVSELTDAVKTELERRFAGLWVEGEISNLRQVSSGHVYFTLKDEAAQVRAVLFRSRIRRLRFQPADGLHVLAFATLEIYAARGEYQLVCEVLEPRGLGALQLAFDQLKGRLASEGLFEPGRQCAAATARAFPAGRSGRARPRGWSRAPCGTPMAGS